MKRATKHFTRVFLMDGELADRVLSAVQPFRGRGFGHSAVWYGNIFWQMYPATPTLRSLGIELTEVL